MPTYCRLTFVSRPRWQQPKAEAWLWHAPRLWAQSSQLRVVLPLESFLINIQLWPSDIESVIPRETGLDVCGMTEVVETQKHAFADWFDSPHQYHHYSFSLSTSRRIWAFSRMYSNPSYISHFQWSCLGQFLMPHQRITTIPACLST